MHKLILQNKALSKAEKTSLEDRFHVQLKEFPNRYEMLVKAAPIPEELEDVRQSLKIDLNVLPAGYDPKNVRLVVSDMDSTLINIECVDEIADFAGVKAEVSQITEAAMRGELDFAESLQQRVKLLAGLEEVVLQRVYDERLKLNPGAEQMLNSLKANNIKFALVSGGFTFFTDRLKEHLRLDFTLSNTLERNNGKLTGGLIGDIVGAEAKAAFLLEKCKELNISPNQAIAIGDGANDLKMMSVAGLGVAYHAKPRVQKEADCSINFGGLDGLLPLLALD